MGGIVKSNLLKRAGVKHGVSERGDQDGKFGQNNVKADVHVSDNPDKAKNNREKIIKSAKLDPEGLVFLRTLPHGNTIFEAHKQDAGHEIDGYDVIVTEDDVTVALSVADCVPVLLYDPENNAVAAVHAGWRGTHAQAAAEAVKFMKRTYKSNPLRMIAVLGPSVCGDCYEVGDDVAGNR